MHLKLGSMKFDFERFYQAVNAKREERAASWRQVAREIGIGKSTLARMSQNKRPDADGLAALSFWAELNPADFVVLEQPRVSRGARLGGRERRDLERIRRPALDLLVVAAARLQARATFQHHDVLAVRAGLELLDVAHVHDQRAMDAQEHFRIER